MFGCTLFGMTARPPRSCDVRTVTADRVPERGRRQIRIQIKRGE
jgi:hypothetical protein